MEDQVVVDATLKQVQVLSMVVGIVLPILVSLVTKQVTDAGTKAVIVAALAGVSGFLTEAINVGGFSGGFDWWAAGLTALMTFVVAVASHYGLWQPTGVDAKASRSLRR